MAKDKSSKLSKLALSKSYNIQALIDKLNNTTAGDLSDRIDGNDYDIENLQTNLTSINTNINLINTKINNFANLFGITFNADGTIDTENYLTHKHDYIDTNNDEDTTKTTQGIK
jgi:hypothetical protein